MQRGDFMELDRIAKHFDADVIIAEETGIENSEFRETDNYHIWTASDKEAKERKEKSLKQSTPQKAEVKAGGREIQTENLNGQVP